MNTPMPESTSVQAGWPQVVRFSRKTLKRLVPAVLAVLFIPRLFAAYLILGLVDVLRNRPVTSSLLTQYFGGNGVFVWLLSPFNLLLDLVCLPYWNKGIYRLEDLPSGYRAEIQTLIDAAHRRDIVGLLGSRMGENKRGMIFFQWYGRMLPTSVEVPEYHVRYRYIRTIGVSIFNRRQSTDRHFGPLRATLRVLYNINPIADPNVYIRVGDRMHRWRDSQLFIFDDTLQHESHNDSDALRFCLFVDIVRPSLVPWLLSAIVSGVRVFVLPVRSVFYKHWTFFK